ncbi:hypothetical protein SCHIN_v1c09140 [Spiroplasma chinense]|uniref:DUF177 domain-containing protein n=1 Tax=Spiroplasma chinense TaxID=216932 RepID=A0A5B9Y5Y1_9MOLU|nr:YceD family protein [Spiroplasma chinense]QEH62109.1 hypothetical protein SCHIN_v1c09140 [Spiroplasma chinense]
MFKKDIEIKKHIVFSEKYDVEQDYQYNHDLIQKVDNLFVEGSITYQENIKSISVNANISCSIKAIDARDGNIVELDDFNVEWDDEYFFEAFEDDQHNVVLGEEFNIKEYAIEQIVLNIPINFTINYGKISFVGKDFKLLSEDEYQQEEQNKVDPRWDKLKEFNFEKE